MNLQACSSTTCTLEARSTLKTHKIAGILGTKPQNQRRSRPQSKCADPFRRTFFPPAPRQGADLDISAQFVRFHEFCRIHGIEGLVV